MIRLLTAEDSGLYKILRLTSLKRDPLVFISTFDFEKEKPDSYFKNKLDNSNEPPFWGTYGYFQDNKLIATTQISTSYLPKKMHTAYLYEVYVLPKYRRNKIASKMIKYLLEKIKEYKKIRRLELKVNSRNTGAIKFYEKLGFNKFAAIKNAICEPDGSFQDEFIYVLEI